MSDELTIQAVNQPQYQPQKKSATPYALGGAAVGAAAGWVGTSMVKKGATKTLDDLVEEANKNDKFEYASEIKSKKAALNDAENKLAEASKAIYDGNEKEALETAIKNRDAELARLTETKTGSKVFNPPAWDKLDIDLSQMDETIVRTENDKKPKKFAMNKKHLIDENSVKKEYEFLVDEYNDAVSNLERKIGNGDRKTLSEKQQIIEDYFKELRQRRVKTNEADYAKVFSTEEPKISTKKILGIGAASVHDKEYAYANEAAEKVYPMFNTSSPMTRGKGALTLDQVKSFAERLEGDKYKAPAIPDGYKGLTVVDEVVDGKNVKVRYVYTDEMWNNFKGTEKERIAGLRDELRSALLNNAGENIQLDKKMKNFDHDFVDFIPKDRAKATGLIDGSGKLDLAALQADAGRAGSSTASGFNAAVYDKDISILESLKNDKGGTKKLKDVIGSKKTKINYKGINPDITVKDALKMATERKNILKEYNAERKSLKAAFDSTLEDYDIIKTLNKKIAETRNSDEAVLKAKEALIAQFPSLADDVERAGLTEAQAMEKESYKRLAKIVEDKQAIYDKVASEKGKINETAKKAAEEAKNKAKAELDNLVNTINSKVKGMSSGAKAAWIAGTAVVGALVGASIVNNKNKKAEEAAKQIIA